MRMHGMCLLNMNDAQIGGVGGLNHQTDCHSCQAAPSTPAPSVTGRSDNMVCNLALLQGGFAQHHHSGLHTHSDMMHSCGSQIAFLPIRISPDRGIEPLIIGNSGSDLHNLQQSTSTYPTSAAPLLTRGGAGHCPCCPFHSYDSGFSDSGCDACANGSASVERGKVSSQLLQPGPVIQNWWKNNNRRLPQQQQNVQEQKVHQHNCSELLTAPDPGMRCNGFVGESFLCSHCLSTSLSQQTCHRQSQHQRHTCRHKDLSNQVQINHSPTTTVQENQSIPRVILKSPMESGEPSIQLVDERQHPQLNDSLLRPEFHHSKSLQDYDHSRHQMAGGQLMEGFPSHRHSTGNTYENIHLKNEINSIAERAMRGNSWGGIVGCQSSTGSKSSLQGGCSPRIETNSPIMNLDASLEESLESNKGQLSGSSNGGQTSLNVDSCSWPDELGDFTGRPSSPSSSGSSEDSSGSSVASWAQNFTGAAENEANWKTLKASVKKLSKCGFYYEHMSMEQAKIRLKELPVGSFLLRDSSHKRFLFSLSAKTTRGVTSVRIEYRNSQFRLDCDEKSQSQTPVFDCVLKLIQYYVELSENKRKNKCVWLESSGRKDTPVILIKPALRGIESLSHMCRKVIHKHIDMERLAHHLKTDFTNLQYLREYPFDL